MIIAQELKRVLEIDTPDMPSSDQELRSLLADHIAHLLASRPEYLMSLLYRLDVLESRIRPVFEPGAPEPVNVALARLVLERQQQRMETKSQIKPGPLEDMAGWEW
jgi:hypothetical protein